MHRYTDKHRAQTTRHERECKTKERKGSGNDPNGPWEKSHLQREPRHQGELGVMVRWVSFPQAPLHMRARTQAHTHTQALCMQSAPHPGSDNSRGRSQLPLTSALTVPHSPCPAPATTLRGKGGHGVQGWQNNHNEKYTQRTLHSHRDRVPDAAHLVGGQAEILPRVFLGHIGDAQGLVKVLKLGLVRWEVPTFLVPRDVWCWASKGTKQEIKRLSLNMTLAFQRAWDSCVLKVYLGPGGYVSVQRRMQSP